MLIPSYHYVYNKCNELKLKGIKPVWEHQFVRHIKWLINHYEILDPKEFINKLEDTNFLENNSDKCIITFDDGTLDQFQCAARILDSFNLKAIFFVLTDVLKNKKMPLSHLLHVALCIHDSKYLIDLIINDKKIQFEYNEKDIEKKATIYNYENNKYRKILKYLVNYELTNFRQQVFSIILESLPEAESDICKKWFASEKDIVNAKNNGHLIGNHGLSHKSYESLSNKEIKNEIIESNNYLKKLLQEDILAFAHPQGGDNGKKNLYAQDVLKNLNYKICFNIIRSKDSSLHNKLDIPRYDAMHLPFDLNK